MKKNHRFSFLTVGALALLTSVTANAIPLFSFETGLDGWAAATPPAPVPPPYGFSPTRNPIDTLAQSTIGATDGTHSLALTMAKDGYAFDFYRESHSGSPDAFYAAMNLASLNEAAWQLELDVTYTTANPAYQFMNLAFFINSGIGSAAGTFHDIQSQALNYPQHNATVHVAIPLNTFSGSGDLLTNADYYQLGVAVNGDWGALPATIYFDSITLSPFPRVAPIPEPTTALFGAVLVGAVATRRRRGVFHSV